MALSSFDSLRYSKHLQAAGIPERQADAHAEAARDFIMPELVTKAGPVTKADLALAFDNVQKKLMLGLTIWIGVTIAAGVATLAVLQRLH